MDDLEHYYSSIYDETDRLVSIRKVMLAFLVILLAASIYTKGTYLYYCTFIVLLLQVAVWWLKLKIDRMYYLAHQFKRNSMLLGYLGESLDTSDLADLKQKVGSRVAARISELQNQKRDSVTYLSDSVPAGPNKLRMMIHENSFFNQHLYKHTYERNIKITVFLSLAAVIPALLFLPYIKADPQLTIPRLVFTLLSFTLIYEFLESTLRYKETAETMRSIDRYISTNTKDDPEKVTEIFAKYNEGILTTPNIPNSVYEKHKEMLNSGWRTKCPRQ